MPFKSNQDPSPVDTWEQDGFEWVEADPYRKWDHDWQREWKASTPTTTQSAVATAKNGWKNMTVASIKSGLYTAASAAASGAASHASNAAANVAATGTAYVSQGIWGKPSAPQYDYNLAKVDAMEQWQPPLNKFNNQEMQDGDAKGATAEGAFPNLGTRTYQTQSNQHAGVRFDESEKTARRERLWAEWRAKPEREPRRIHEKPQLRIGGRLVDTTSIGTRTDHGYKENFQSDEERESDRGPIPGLLFALDSDSGEDEPVEPALQIGQTAPHSRRPQRA